VDLDRLVQSILRHRLVAVAGFGAAVVLAFLSYMSVNPFRSPMLEHRKEAFWASAVTLQVTQAGFPEGRTTVPTSADPGRLVGLAQLYTSLVNTDPVRKKMPRPIYGSLSTEQLLTPQQDALPLLKLTAVSRSGAKSVRRARTQAAAFASFILANQARSKVPPKQRVELHVVSGPTKPRVVSPPSKTLPVLVFLSMLTATLALVLVLENRRRGREPQVSDIGDGLHDEPEHDEDRQVVAFEKPLTTSDRARTSGDHVAVRKAESAIVPERSAVAGTVHGEPPPSTTGMPGSPPATGRPKQWERSAVTKAAEQGRRRQ
jgi:hypothetical protein